MKNKSLKQLKILGVKISSTNKNEVLDFVSDSLDNMSKFFVSTPNPEIVLMAQEDKELMAALNSADIALVDGVGLVWAANYLGLGNLNRIQGRAIFEDLLTLANKSSLKVYLLGATKEVNDASLAKIREHYPKVKAEGASDIKVNREGYSETDNDIKSHIDTLRHINKSKPELLFVALGAPKQEKWVYHNFDKLDVGGVMVIGGTLDTFSGKVNSPPAWMARVGLEWFWRVLQEPRRIKRIFQAVVVFPFAVLTKRLSG